MVGKDLVERGKQISRIASAHKLCRNERRRGYGMFWRRRQLGEDLVKKKTVRRTPSKVNNSFRGGVEGRTNIAIV